VILPFFASVLYIAIFLFLGLFAGKTMKLIHFPNVTGYVLFGIIFGPFCLGAIVDACTGITDSLGLATFFLGQTVNPSSFIQTLDISFISNIALGFIAFSIGGSFKKSALAKTGKRIIITTILEALGASLFVLVALLIAYFIAPDRFPLPIVLTLAAIAAATAPAGTLLIVRQYKARGAIVDTLLPVVALDDVAALVSFSILFSIAKAITGGNINIYTIFVVPLLEINLSLLLGTIVGFFASYLTKIFHSNNNRLIVLIASILFASAFSNFSFFPKGSNLESFAFSPLLTCMMAGAIYINKGKDPETGNEALEKYTPPLFMLFFIISGASLDLSIFYKDMNMLLIFLPIAFIYLIMRALGKYTGAYLGSAMDKQADPRIKKYLGFMLLPQAGVAIGLATSAGQSLGGNLLGYSYGEIIVAVILTTTLIYSFAGSYLTKWALFASGEATRGEANSEAI
jgi:Kef-type K+ transport system membrane component KefB